MKQYRVIVSNQARHSLRNIIQYIKKESPSAASYVKKTIIGLLYNLGSHPEKFSKEPLLDHKSGNYRSVSKWHYKIIYRITDKQVIVLDIIHTSRNPDIIKEVS